MTVSTNNLEYIRKWQNENTKVIQLRLNVVNDADVLEKLNSVANKNGYIKELIRKDMRGQ